jgi:hypothetical protein
MGHGGVSNLATGFSSFPWDVVFPVCILSPLFHHFPRLRLPLHYGVHDQNEELVFGIAINNNVVICNSVWAHYTDGDGHALVNRFPGYMYAINPDPGINGGEGWYSDGAQS